MKSLIFSLICSFGIHCTAFCQITGCTDPQSTNYNPLATINDGSCLYSATNLALADKTNLSTPLLNETSGLTFINGKLWTFNDSGNANDIYRIDTASSTVYQTVDISNATNTDWEDMASNNDYLFIGDFGNNNGNRQDLKIYRINKTALTTNATSVTASIINFSYSDQSSFPSLPTNNNFDCEAMIFLNDSIHLFSKNWVDFQTKHYVLPATPGTHVAQYRETYNTGFLVTSASVQEYGVIALIGYLRTGTKPVSLCMIYDYKNNLLFNGNKRKFDLSTQVVQGQVEGVEFFNSSQAFVTNELYTTGANVPAKLRTFQLAPYLPASFLYPKPSADFSGNNLTICENATVNFTDQSSNTPTSWQWSFPGGTPSTSTLQNPQVTYAAGGIYSVTLVASNAAGSDTLVKTNYISVNTTPASPTIPNGTSVACINNNNITYSISAVNGATSYAWSVPSGATIISGQGTNSINVNFSALALSGDICVVAANTCGNSAQVCKAITVFDSIPAKPISISGGIVHCAGSTGATFSCPLDVNATSYNWTVPSTAILVSGQGTNSITVNFLSNFTSGTINVSAVNCLGSSDSKKITVIAKPSKPKPVTGLTEGVCAGTTNVIYTIPSVYSATSYTWTVPANATIVSGQGTTILTVNYGSPFTSGWLDVTASNSCGTSNVRRTFIRSVPVKPNAISGTTSVCANQTGVTYSIASVSGATSYNWLVPAGAVITSGQTTTSITVNFGTGGGNVKVRSVNACGNSGYSTLSVSVTCRESFDSFENNFDVTVFPNPSNSHFVMNINTLINSDATIFVRDLAGREIQKIEHIRSNQEFEFGATLVPGVYIAEVHSGNEHKIIRLVKQK